ncbi:mis18-binding protein 1 isoform 2-T2 [Odontesthes bonariensis]|uniref:mis18-binding protein 1 isoform X2 n=1 Tax=Odontesthes bonariensis TaxID=219752 RepID=UPI003F58B490
MASYNLLQHTNPRFESPAKVFAKLKSKVIKEALCANEGFFTGKDPLCNVIEKAGFKSPGKKAASTWTTTDLNENRRFDSYLYEAQALTLSPISSPEKTLDHTCSVISKPLEETYSGTKTIREYTRRNGAVFESTAVSHPLSVVNSDQIDNGTPHIRESDGFHLSGRTPVKIHPLENYGKSVFDTKCAPLTDHMSPANVLSPMRKRLRKRKWEQQKFSKVSGTTEESYVGISPPQERETSAFIEDYTHTKTLSRDLAHVTGSSVDPSEKHHEPMFSPPRSQVIQRCAVIMERCPTMSPAKMFALMKEREGKREQQDVHNSSRRDLFGPGNPHQSRDTSVSTAHSVGEMGDVALRRAPETVYPIHQCRAVYSSPDTDRSEDALNPSVPPQPILLEDPLLLNSPQISIPKRREAVFKRNPWPKQKKFPVENVIYLKKWFLRKNQKGLFVDGIHREDNIPWNSNIIVDRVSNTVLKTVSGRVYVLVGKMKKDLASDFPKWLLKKFVSGFPPNWKALYERHLLESKDRAETGNEMRRITGKANTEASSINQKSFKTPKSHPPTCSSSTTVSRSGRVIKPPLEYWKGGRVILDAQMNVTIHECYDASKSEVSTLVSPRVSQKSIRVFLPCGEGRKQRESATEEGASVPVRMVKALRKRETVKVNPEQKPTHFITSAVEMLSSPEQWCGGRITRSSQRRTRPATERGSYVDAAPQKQSLPEKSKQETRDTSRPSTRASGRKRTNANPTESPPVNDQTTGDELSRKIERRDKSVRRKKGRKVQKKSPPDHEPSSNQSPVSSQEGWKALRKRAVVNRKCGGAQTKHKERNSTETSPPAKPLLKLKQSNKRDQANKGNTVIPREQDGDEWTEAELLKLREAVTYFPKHITGYWAKVARMVGTRSAEECHNQHTSQGASQTPAKKAKSRRKEKVEDPKLPVTERPVISARAGTLKRKQQVRQFLETLPREDVDDAFSSAYMQNKRCEIPSLCQSDDHDFQLSDLEPETPTSSCFPEVKTPQCLHITPGMMGSPNANNDDKYVYQLQKRMKKNQFNVCKNSPSSKRFTPTPSVKRTMRRGGNTESDTFVVWEMFPGNDGAPSDSEEEEDFYFSDD